jgi:hypothetical protein
MPARRRSAGLPGGAAGDGTVRAELSYQTTNPATNALTGTPNTPVDHRGQ